ncbi:hypothetical protein [Bacillus tuaregi]|uniref:hypothetical protein n=1 Tax=Bacillus tuaregi TaxID=1816695 RepID=UPI000B10078A|nr:hypothetical protein [Bacillus tuaregi]
MADMDTVKFLMALKRYKDVLPKQTMKTLKGQALSGDVEGAKKGLKTVLRRRVGRCERAQ